MKPAVVLSDVDLSYGVRPILNDLSFSVYQGEFFIIIGPNGSGKTTLLKVISGSARPQRGAVEVLGCPLRSYSGKELARNVAMVPQVAPVDVPFTVAEVVLMGRSPYLGLLGLEQRKDLEIAERAMAFTGVDDLAGRRLDQLSSGERQRVLIARAICQQARIIVLDEPTASLDLAHQIRIMDLMESLGRQQRLTVIMVSHDLNLAAMYADRLLLMKQGRIVRLGEPREVLTFDVLEQTYGCVLLVDDNPVRAVPRITLVPGDTSGQNQEVRLSS
jgi:iron complex transport system ATP-binding protein